MIDADEAPPLLSIGLPVLNGEKTLRETMNNLLKQTFGRFELIVSNNHSTDRTVDILAEFRDPRIRSFDQPTTLPAIENFRFVRDQARGRYFMWAAADDLRDDTFVERAVRLLEETPDAVGAFGSIVLVDDRGEVLERRPPIHLGARSAALRLAYLARYREDITFYGVWRTEALRSLRLAPWLLVPNHPNNAAYPVLAALVAQGRIAVDPDAVFRYRVHHRPHGGVLALRTSILVSLNTVGFSAHEVFRSTGSWRLAATSLVAFGGIQGYAISRTILRHLGQRLSSAAKSNSQ